MTDEQKEAVEWLREFTPHCKHRETAIAMLAEPRLPRPEDVPEAVLVKMADAHDAETSFMDAALAAYRALYDHYTALRTKKVEVWRVEAAKTDNEGAIWTPIVQAYATRADAEAEALFMQRKKYHYACIRVTGPHQQEVPTDDNAR